MSNNTSSLPPMPSPASGGSDPGNPVQNSPSPQQPPAFTPSPHPTGRPVPPPPTPQPQAAATNPSPHPTGRPVPPPPAAAATNPSPHPTGRPVPPPPAAAATNPSPHPTGRPVPPPPASPPASPPPPPIGYGGGGGDDGSSDDDPAKKSLSKGLMAAGIIGAVVLIGAGAYIAINNFMAPSGTHAYEAFPADGSIMYAEVNLDPTAEQKKSWLSLSKKFDLEGDEGKSIRELASDQLGDFSKIDPWLGGRVAVLAYKDLGTDGEEDPFIAYQINDADKAESFGKSYGEPYVVLDDYFVITASSEGQVALDALTNVKGDSLADNKEFQSDLNAVGEGNVVHAWVDLAGASELAETVAEANVFTPNELIGDTETPEVSGRIVMSAALKKDGVEASFLGRDILLNDKPVSTYSDLSPIGDEFKNLPVGMAALSISGLDETLKSAWDEPELADEMRDVEEAGSQLGLSLPEDVTKIIGDAISVSVDFAGGSDANVYANLRNADMDTLNRVLADSGLTMDTDMQLATSDTGVALTYQNPTDTKIGDTPEVVDTLIDLDKAGAAIFIDLDGLQDFFINELGGMGAMEVDAPDAKPAPEPLGKLGITANNDDSDWNVQVKWVTE